MVKTLKDLMFTDSEGNYVSLSDKYKNVDLKLVESIQMVLLRICSSDWLHGH